MVARVSKAEGVEHAGDVRAAGTYPCFDGIRAIAALSVVVYHAVFFTTWFRTPGGSFLWNLNSGVWVFFVTSGFLLYRPFVEANLNGGPHVGLRGYAIRRVARIYPAYWAVLAFFTFVMPKTNLVGVGESLRNATLTQTYFPARNPFLVGVPPAWSLVVEITFYAFLPLYAAAVGLATRRWPAGAVELTGVGLLAVAGLAAVVAIADGYTAAWITVLPQNLMAFAFGMLVAVLSARRSADRTLERLHRLGRPAWLWWTLAGLAFVSIPLILGVEPFAPLGSGQIIGLGICQTLIGACIVVPAVFGPQDHGFIRRVLRSRVLVFLGVISYGIYLSHWFVLVIVQHDWLGWSFLEGSWVVLLAVALPVVIAAASLSWYALERPVMRSAHTFSRS